MTDLADLAIKISMPILVGVTAWAFGKIWGHEKRLTVVETKADSVAEDIREIKKDVKELLSKQ